MSLNKPEVLVDATRYFSKYIGCIGIPQRGRFVDGGARFAAKGGQSFGDRLHVGHPVSDHQWIFFEPGSFGGDAHGTFCNSSQLNDTLGNQIDVRFDSLIYVVEQFVQSNEVWAFDIPMSLFELHLKIHRICQTLVQ